MAITARCPACGEEFHRPDGFGGKLEKCPSCRKVMRMPERTSAPSGTNRDDSSNEYGDRGITPNPEHYRRVLQVLSASEGVWAQLRREMNVDSANLACLGPCKAIWEQEFPIAEGYGDTVALDLRGADLRGRFFAGQRVRCLNHADFSHANLQGSKWLFIHAKGAKFADADLRQSTMMAFYCDGSVFCGADLSGAELLGVFMDYRDSSKAIDFSGANLTGARFALHSPLQLILTGAQVQSLRIPRFRKSIPADHELHQRAIEMFLAALSPEQRQQIILEPEQVIREKAGLPALGRCFIATAAFGTEQAPQVVCLQTFRDHVLLRSGVGRLLVCMYEWLSPPLANCIHRSEFARAVIRKWIITPASQYAWRVLRRKGVDLPPLNDDNQMSLPP